MRFATTCYYYHDHRHYQWLKSAKLPFSAWVLNRSHHFGTTLPLCCWHLPGHEIVHRLIDGRGNFQQFLGTSLRILNVALSMGNIASNIWPFQSENMDYIMECRGTLFVLNTSRCTLRSIAAPQHCPHMQSLPLKILIKHLWMLT